LYAGYMLMCRAHFIKKIYTYIISRDSLLFLLFRSRKETDVIFDIDMIEFK